MDLYVFEATLVYKTSSRTVRAVTQRSPVLSGKARKKILVQIPAPSLRTMHACGTQTDRQTCRQKTHMK